MRYQHVAGVFGAASGSLRRGGPTTVQQAFTKSIRSDSHESFVYTHAASAVQLFSPCAWRGYAFQPHSPTQFGSLHHWLVRTNLRSRSHHRGPCHRDMVKSEVSSFQMASRMLW